jgi:phosphoglycolate phosphatase-like HAD superfamily hydrolase
VKTGDAAKLNRQGAKKRKGDGNEELGRLENDARKKIRPCSSVTSVVNPGSLQKKLFLFDIDGTLLASGGAGLRALEASCSELFGTPDLDGIDVAGRTDSSIVRQLFTRHGREFSAEGAAKFFDRYLEQLAHLLPVTGGRLLPGVVQLLDALRARPGCTLALLTGNLERGARLKLTHYGVWHYFEFGAYADDHHDRNALGPVARERAKSTLGLEFEAEEIFVLGDTPHDVACARAIGARAVAFATGRHTRGELEPTAPDFLFDDLSDVEGVLSKLGVT